ncbi:NYN domain-containing protein, partial [Candidatus Pacearchaeota archaeon]|nr:NYN domain-containing protein [Candidatus Pacearchaeota archaeon]
MNKKVKKLTKNQKRNNFLKGRVAVFIDAANIERSLADLGIEPPRIKKLRKGFHWKPFPKGYWKMDYKKLRKFFVKRDRLVSINFYSARFGSRGHDDFLAFLKRNGYRLLTKSIKEVGQIEKHRKANFDVEIAVDAIGWMDNYDTFVLFSGDSDFTYLLEFLRRRGKKTIVISQRGHVAKELVKEADFYRDI